MKHVLACTWLVLLSCRLMSHAQEPLNNETILKLVKAGISEETIVGMVNQQPGKYFLADSDISALKFAGVSEKIIAAMIVKSAQQPKPATPTSQPPSDDGQTFDNAIRVYVSDSQSWEIRGGWGEAGHTTADGSGDWGGAGYQAGGARPQTAEIIKTFNQRCPEVTVTNSVQKAAYAVILDHEGGKGYLRHRNKIVVFNRDGDDIFSDSTRELGNSVKNACMAIVQNVSARLARSATSNASK